MLKKRGPRDRRKEGCEEGERVLCRSRKTGVEGEEAADSLIGG